VRRGGARALTGVMALALAACQGTAGPDAASGGLKEQFRVDTGLQAFADGCLVAPPSAATARAAAEAAGIRFDDGSALSGSFRTAMSFEPADADDVARCRIFLRGDGWGADALAFLRSAMPAKGFRAGGPFVPAEPEGSDVPDRLLQTIAFANGQAYAIGMAEAGRSSRNITDGTRFTISGTYLFVVGPLVPEE